MANRMLCREIQYLYDDDVLGLQRFTECGRGCEDRFAPFTVYAPLNNRIGHIYKLDYSNVCVLTYEIETEKLCLSVFNIVERIEMKNGGNKSRESF